MSGHARHNHVECGQINVVVLALGILLLLVPGIAHSESHALKFEKEIGIGWQGDKNGWMGFVSFSPDGTMVASDGPAAPGDVSDSLTLWSFPEGRLIQRLLVRPSAISSDWKYYASYHGVAKMENGEPLISLGDSVYAVHAFSPDSRFLVTPSTGGLIRWPYDKGGTIRVFRVNTP